MCELGGSLEFSCCLHETIYLLELTNMHTNFSQGALIGKTQYKSMNKRTFRYRFYAYNDRLLFVKQFLSVAK